MKVVIIFALMSACLGLDFDLEWKSYKESFNKLYTDETEDDLRKNIFREKFLEHQKHNELYAAGKVSYTKGVNIFTDWTEEELRQLTPALVIPDSSTDDVLQFKYNRSLTVPDFFDWRRKGAVTRVKDQRHCGSCYAFGSVGAIEGALFIKSKKLVDLSVQNVVDCSEKYGNKGCRGGWTTSTYKYVKSNEGIDSQKSYPYEAVRKECRYKSNLKSVATSISSYKELKGEEALKQAVATVGPVSVALSAEHFYSYHGGILDRKCVRGPDHIVLIVGYGSENGHDYWIIKNSWGQHFGEKGYLRLARNKNLCSVANHASYPII